MKILNTKNLKLKKSINKKIQALVQLLHHDLLSLEHEIQIYLDSLKPSFINDWHIMADPNSPDLSFIIEVFDLNNYPMEFYFKLP